MVLISAHSGGSEHAAAATREAYQDALTSGADYVEFDIRKTGDNTLVVYHDARASGTGPYIADLSYDELCNLLGYRAPKACDVMEMIAGKMIGQLDLKETGYEEEVIRLALSILGSEHFIATTLEDSSIATIKQLFPSVRTALSLGRDLVDAPRRQWARIRYSELFPIRRLRDCASDWAAVNYKLARLRVIEECRRNGIGVMVWTVDSDALIDHFLNDQRIEVLITNRPHYAVRRRQELATAPS